MCGIAAMFGSQARIDAVHLMAGAQRHRGPDDAGVFLDAGGRAALGQSRLSIIDLSAGGHQPMANRDGSLWITFNGEIYNYRELRAQLNEYPFRSSTDTEVILAAYERWGRASLNRFAGMFAFVLWDARTQKSFAVRDRFGIKPLYYSADKCGGMQIASEIQALHAAGVAAKPNAGAWATYLSYGFQDHSEETFWDGIQALPPGHCLEWSEDGWRVDCWYDLAAVAGTEYDRRPVEEVKAEYLALLDESLKLRFRSDVPVGINLSGGLDSSTLLGLVHRMEGPDSAVQVYTFATGDPYYDELPWVRRMLQRTLHPCTVCTLGPGDVPGLAEAVHRHQAEPFGGIPTLAYARLFEQARAEGTIVLLDGQGMDEQWAGYDYYGDLQQSESVTPVQGSAQSPVRPECLIPEFRGRAVRPRFAEPFPDRLRNVQFRDIRYTKIPRALRFNDRVSMRASTELREPFLDHRLVELALRQPADRKIRQGVHKWLLRQISREVAPAGVTEPPKRPLQTPQREWLRGPLRGWANDRIEAALEQFGGAWLDPQSTRAAWNEYVSGGADNSFFVWQWIGLGLMAEAAVAA